MTAVSELKPTQMPDDGALTLAQRLELEVGILAGRLAGLLRNILPSDSGGTNGSVAFLESRYQAVAGDRHLDTWVGSAIDRRRPGAFDPFDRLVAGLGLSALEAELLILAALPEQHEGFAEVMRVLHPETRPCLSIGLAGQLLFPCQQDRQALRRLLTTGRAACAGALVVEGDGPFVLRSLRLADDLWPVLQGVDAWPDTVARRDQQPAVYGLEAWLREPAVLQARGALEAYEICTVVVSADDEDIAFERASALAEIAVGGSVRIELPTRPADAPRDLEKLIALHSLARGVVPVLRLPHSEGPGMATIPSFDGHAGPIVVGCRTGGAVVGGSRPLLAIHCERLRPTAVAQMWRQTLPGLATEAELLASRYPLEPAGASQVAVDLERIRVREGRIPVLADVAASVRARSRTNLSAGVRIVRPTAGWAQLVLPPERLAQLREAVNRLYHQGKVLDEWRFLEGRQGARGVRMLFSGPPGTGKTFSAEVLAREFGVDLLVVDLAQVVSKWIGETEKNLAQAFEVAEQARAVLLFDEADALFGKRTEVSDAHDRYANLETAYLLTRLERFEGLAILSTNLRQNIDEAFTRRLEFIVEYQEPDRYERLALWRCHLPAGAPVAADVDLEELAAVYPMVGGMIRNCAVAAAFLAASEDAILRQSHFVRAIRREYEKTGTALPSIPRGIRKA